MKAISRAGRNAVGIASCILVMGGLSVRNVRADDADAFPLGALGGKGLQAPGSGLIKITEVTAGGPAAAAGLLVGDHIHAVNGAGLSPISTSINDGWRGAVIELGNALELAGSTNGQVSLGVLRPGAGALTLNAAIAAATAWRPSYPVGDPRADALYEKACADLHAKVQASSTADFGYNSGWFGMVLLSSPNWNDTTGAKPYRNSIDKLRVRCVNYLNGRVLEPVEPSQPGFVDPGLENWDVASASMFIGEYRRKTGDASVDADVQRAALMLANRIQCNDQPDDGGTMYTNKHGIMGHGGVTGDYAHLWLTGLNIVNAHTTVALATLKGAGADFAAMAGASGLTIDQKFLANWDWLKRCTRTDNGSDDGCVGYQGVESGWDAAGRTAGTAAGYQIYLNAGGTPPTADDLDKLARQKAYVVRHWQRQQHAHAYTVGGVALSQTLMPFLGDREQRHFMENSRFYFTMSRDHTGAIQYFPGRGNNGGDSYLDFNSVKYYSGGLFQAVTNGNLPSFPAPSASRAFVRMNSPANDWPQLAARRAKVVGLVQNLNLDVTNNLGVVLTSGYTATWSQVSGAAVAFSTTTTEDTTVTFPAVGTYRLRFVANVGSYTVTEDYDFEVAANVTPPLANVLVTQPVSRTGVPGGNATFTVGATGTGPFLYEWRLNGVSYWGASTNPTLGLTNISPNHAGSYVCTVYTPTGILTSAPAVLTIPVITVLADGGLLREVWTGLSGGSVANLTGNLKYPLFPDVTGVVNTAEGPNGYADSYGQKLSGWVLPPVTGQYKFFLASDDASELWLSTTDAAANKVKIAQVAGYTGYRAYSSGGQSALVPLVAGQRYYIEVLHKEGGGGDHLSVAWQLPGGAVPANGSEGIPAANLQFASTSADPELDGLVSWWKMDEGAGTVATDVLATSNDGTLTGATWTAGVRQGALAFDGNDKVVCGTSGSLNGAIPFSVSAWVKVTAGSASEAVVVQQRASNGYNGQYQLKITAAGKIGFYVYGNSAEQFNFAGATSINDGQWHHIAATRDAAGNAYVFLDGVQDGSVTGTTVRSLASGISIGIGCDIRDSVKFFRGSIDDVRVYSRQLSAAEISSIRNKAPVFPANPIAGAAAVEDSTYAGSLTATDANADVITFSKVDGPAWLAVAANGTLSGTPANGDVGANAFTVRVTDALGGSADATLNIAVANTNDAPAFAVNPINTTATEDSTFSGQLAATDVDAGDTLTYAKVGGPAWLAVGTTGALSGTPANGDVGANAFTVRVTDGSGATADATLNVTVANTNDAPAFAVNPINTTATEDSTFSGQLAATDVDAGDTLTYAKVGGPAWLAVGTTGALSGTPANGDVGANAFTVRVTDGSGASADATLNVTVANTNDAPVFAVDPIVLKSLKNTAFTASLSATDTDNGSETLVYGKVSGPAWLAVAANGALTGTPLASAVGINTFVVRVTDPEGATDEATLTVEVTDEPVWTNPAGGSWELAGNWLEGFVADGNSNRADFSTLDLTADAVVTLDGSRTIAGLMFADATPSHKWAIHAGTAGPLTLDAGSGAPEIMVANQSASINSVVAGTQGFVKSGIGTLVLGAANSFTGGVTINSGTVKLQSGDYTNTLASANTVTINTGGVLVAVNTNTSNSIAGFVINSGGTLECQGYHEHLKGVVLNGGTITGTGTGKYASEDFALDADLVVGGSSASLINIANGMGIGTGNRTFIVPDVTASPAADLIISGAGALRNSGTLVKTGSGTLLMNNANAHGSTVVNNGSVKLGFGGATGTIRGTLTVNDGASVDYTANNTFGWSSGQSVNSMVVNGGTVGGSNYGQHFWNGFQLTMTGGTLHLGGTTNEWSNATVTVTASPVTARVLGVGTTPKMNLRDSTPILFNIGDGSQDVDLLVDVPITQNGTSAVSKSGAGTLEFGKASTYTGATNVNAGTLLLTGSLANSTATVAAAGTLAGNGSTAGAVVVHGTLAPGNNGAGTLAVNNTLTLAGASSLVWQIADWNGQEGTGYDKVTATALDITATSASPLVLRLSALALANFSEIDRSFTLVQTSAGITGFSADKFTVDATGIPVAQGTWSVQQSGGNLLLVYTRVNIPPSFDADPILVNAMEDQPLGTALNANDGDAGEILAYTKTDGPSWLTVASDGTLGGTPANSDVGPNVFTVRVTDSRGAFDDATLNVAVANTNDAPAFAVNPINTTATEDSTFSGQLAATDVDAGDTLTYAKVGGPAWLAVGTTGALSGTPANGDVGANAFTVRVTDGSGATADATLNITVANTNDAPAFAVNPINTTATEDSAFTGQLAATDVDAGDTLTYAKVGGPAWLAVSTTGALSGTPANGDVGANAFTVRVTDGSGASADATLNVTVANTNDAPVFAASPMTRPDATEGMAYTGQTLAGSASDVDAGDTLSYSLVSGPAWLVVGGDGALSGTPATGTAGPNTFVVRVTDGSGASSDATLNITVINSMIAWWKFNEGSGTVAADSSGQGRDATMQGATWTMPRDGYAAIATNGTASQYVQAPSLDTAGGLTITAWIKPAALNGHRALVSEKNSYVFKTNGAGLLFTTPGILDHYSSGVTLVANQWTHVAVTFQPSTTGGVKFYVNGVLASTGNSSALNQSTEPTILGNATNWTGQEYNGAMDDVRIYGGVLPAAMIAEIVAAYPAAPAPVAPAFANDPIAGTAASEDAAYAATLAGGAVDPDVGDTLTFTKVSGPAWLAIAANGALSGTPANADVGGNTFVVRVTDSTGLSDEASLSIVVANTNDAPVFTANPMAATATEDNAFTGQLTASDVDAGDTLSFSKVSGPAWLVVSTTGALSGMPANADVGANAFTVRATDGSGASADATLDVTVANANDAPVFAANPINTTATEDSAFSGQLTASDVDAGDSLGFSKVSGPAWLVVSATGALSGTPANADVGANAFTVRVTDGSGASADATLNVTVANTNDAPVFIADPVAKADATEGVAYTGQSLAGSAGDVDTGDTLSYSKVSGPAWLAVAANGTLTGTPTTGTAGPNAFVVRVTDGSGASADAALNITVIAAGLPLPWLTGDIGTTGLAGSALHNSGAYTVSGAGVIGGTGDAERFAYQTLSGDGSIIARVSTLGATGGTSARVGIQIRETLAANSRATTLAVTGAGAYKWMRRTTVGGSTSNTNSSSGTAPNIWIRLVRAGNVITASKSTNGTTWTTIGSVTVTMASNCYIGLAVGSGSTTSLNTSVFSNVTVVP